jgi:hypothetical protein
MFHGKPDGGSQRNDVFNPASSGSNPSEPRLPLFPPISTTFSCPNLKLHAFRQKNHKGRSVSTPNHVFRGSQLQDAQYIPAWRRLSGKAKSGKLSKLPGSSSASRRTYEPVYRPCDDAQNNSTRPPSFLPSHLTFLAPLDSNGIPMSTEQLAPITGELNRYNPVWQNLELKKKLANHREVKKKISDFSNRYEALSAEFENLHLDSELKLRLQKLAFEKSRAELEADYEKTLDELIKYTSEARQVSTNPRISSYERMSDATTQTWTEQISSPTWVKDSSTQTLVEDTMSIVGHNEAATSARHNNSEHLTSTLKDIHVKQAGQEQPNHANESFPSIVTAAMNQSVDYGIEANDSPRSSPRELGCLPVRYNFHSFLEDILEEIERMVR